METDGRSSGETDGRSVVKERHRQAILDAAATLVHDGSRFSADELAEQAGVSRRTIFNHFGSLDDVLLAVCTETLRVVTAQLGTDGEVVADGSRAAMFSSLADALRRADLSGPIVQVWSVLGGVGQDPHRTQAFAQQALAMVADELTAQLTRRHPSADPLDVALLARLLTHGLGVIGEHWVGSAAPGTTPQLAGWEPLLERLLGTLGEGYLPRPGAARPGSARPGPVRP